MTLRVQAQSSSSLAHPSLSSMQVFMKFKLLVQPVQSRQLSKQCWISLTRTNIRPPFLKLYLRKSRYLSVKAIALSCHKWLTKIRMGTLSMYPFSKPLISFLALSLTIWSLHFPKRIWLAHPTRLFSPLQMMELLLCLPRQGLLFRY